ncbi:hypothetical protein [Endozoicomonas acroporae]|uniref:hypothetical protein n=1 Tax=Endozoicomonas acroporae TaxID=1701104 RepID=UPI003D7B0026
MNKIKNKEDREKQREWEKASHKKNRQEKRAQGKRHLSLLVDQADINKLKKIKEKYELKSLNDAYELAINLIPENLIS